MTLPQLMVMLSSRCGATVRSQALPPSPPHVPSVTTELCRQDDREENEQRLCLVDLRRQLE